MLLKDAKIGKTVYRKPEARTSLGLNLSKDFEGVIIDVNDFNEIKVEISNGSATDIAHGVKVTSESSLNYLYIRARAVQYEKPVENGEDKLLKKFF